jgi:integrase
MQWWLDTYSIHMPAHTKNVGTVKCHIVASPIADRALERVTKGDIESLLQSKQGALAPQTINHIREFIVRAFNKAAEADKWFGDNPAEVVKPRKVPDPHHDILTPEEVMPFFAALAPGERPIFAAAIFTGLRKSELCGLLKTDVDLGGRRITVCRSYTRPWPKGRKKRVVRIAAELVPFIEYALEALPGLWLFPDRHGRMHTPHWKPEKILRTALRRAGIVTGFVHVCRRKGCGHQQEEKDRAQRTCPKCNMKLWPRARSRPLRFHELRHTFGSMLIMSGANLVSVQKLLGHSNPKITAETYAHLAPDYLLAEVNLLRFGVDQLAPVAKISQPLSAESTPRVTPELQSGSEPLPEPNSTSDLPHEIPLLEVAGCTGLEPVASGVTGRRYNQLN